MNSSNQTTQRGIKMENAIMASIAEYANLAGMTEKQVLIEIQSGNESIKRSVQMLMFAVAK